MRGVTDLVMDSLVRRGISTRTPHAGSDVEGGRPAALFYISTRTPHAGSDCER